MLLIVCSLLHACIMNCKYKHKQINKLTFPNTSAFVLVNRQFNYSAKFVHSNRLPGTAYYLIMTVR